MKIIVGMPVKDRAWVLPEWFDAVHAQGTDVEVIVKFSASEDDTERILLEEGALILYDTDIGRTRPEIDGHLWGNEEGYNYLARMRNELLEVAWNMGADYYFSLDSDIILSPDSLNRLLERAEEHGGTTAPAVNMSIGMTVWNTMSWVDPMRPRMAYRPLGEPVGGQVDVVMAAMLLDRSAMEVCRWVGHHQGEDVGYSIHAREASSALWWHPEVPCQHLMRRA